ncbi:unnamed protein product [Calicophoron daubneyi]|uniref:Retinoblastoma-like protein 1 n=1 Tax=Calicophoron daubneyi TaxID=300641 RepID=A0AAV2TAG7_CALDB
MQPSVDFDYEEPIEKRFEDLCQDLCIEGAIREEAWEKYKEVWANYSIDGDQLHWLVCSLYECCRRSLSDSPSGQIVDNAYVSLSRLLSAAKMSMVQFFHRIRKWADMTDMTDDMRDRVELLERQFAVSSVIFRNFGRPFGLIFSDLEYDRRHRHPTGADLFRFTWLLFIKSRASFPAVTDDLVNSYHLLACCLDWVLGAVMVSRRPDLINLEFHDLPKEFLAAVTQKKSWCPPHDEPPCMLRPICEDNDVNYVECKTVKEHFFRPFIMRLIDKELIKLHPAAYGSLLESENFEVTLQNLNNNYEEYIIGTADFDERIYLSPNAAEEIGSTGETGVQSDLGLFSDLAPSARRYMLELSNAGFGGFTETTRRGSANAGAISRLNGGVNFNNPEARNQNLNQLQILLSGRTKEPSEALIDLIEAHCSVSPVVNMDHTLSELSMKFQQAYAGTTDVHAEDSSGVPLAISAAQQRLHLGYTFYYMALENILVDEIRKIERRLNNSSSGVGNVDSAANRRARPDLANLLSQDIFHRALFACCMELVLIGCDPPARHFPWVLEALDLDALHFFKVIEVVIRNVDFSRDVVKYMNQVAELILDSFAWRSTSPLWAMIKAAGRAPSIEEVIPPEKLDQSSSGGHLKSGSLVGDIRRSSAGPGSTLVIKPSPSPAKQPRLLAGGLNTQSKIIRPRSDMSSTSVARHLLSGSGAEDESAQAAAQLLASGADEDIHSSGPHLLSSTTEEVVGSGGTEQADGPIKPDVPASIWPNTNNALSGYYPARHDSLAIFFRQIYLLASLRLRDLCERLNLNREVLAKVWTCVEQVIIHDTELLRDRCLDQILLCCLYSVCKVALYRPLSFVDIIQVYRMQPQSNRDIYRRVLITRMDYGHDTTEERGDISRFYNIVFLPEMKEFIKKAAVVDSALGHEAATSSLPGVGLASATSVGTTSGVGGGVVPAGLASGRADSLLSRWAPRPTLSPMPVHVTLPSSSSAPTITGSLPSGAVSSSAELSQSRRLATNRNIFISPVKQQVSLSPRRVVFTVGQSTGKELQDVNLMISSAERRASMANLTMGLKRPPGSTTVSYQTSTSGGFVMSPATSCSRTVTLVGPSGFAAKRIEFDV